MSIGIAQLTGSKRSKYLKDFNYLQPNDFKSCLLDPKDCLGDIEPADQTEQASRFSTMIDLMTRYFIFNDAHAFDNAKRVALKSDLEDFYDSAINCLNSYRANQSARFQKRNVFDKVYGLAELENAAKSHRPVVKDFPELSPLAISHAKQLLHRLWTYFNQADSNYIRPTVNGFHVHDQMFNQIYGEGDYLADGVLYDLKVVKNCPLDNPGYRAQLAFYYIFGRDNFRDTQGQSGYKHFATIRYVSFLDPRHNRVWFCPVAKIDETMEFMIENVIPGAVAHDAGLI